MNSGHLFQHCFSTCLLQTWIWDLQSVLVFVGMYLAPYSGKVEAIVDLWNCQTLSLKVSRSIFNDNLGVETKRKIGEILRQTWVLIQYKKS